MDEPKAPADNEAEVNALEAPAETDSAGIAESTSTDGQANPQPAAAPTAAKKPSPIKALLARFNIYLLLLGLIMLVGIVILVVAQLQNQNTSQRNTIKTQDLTQATLEQIAGSDATVGDPQQILNVQSSAVFAGKVLVKDGLQVATNLQVGGTSALTNLSVSGTSQLSQAQVDKDLSVAGNTSLQGSLTARSLQVSGTGSFSGALSAPQITTSNFQLNGNLVLTRHIKAGGPTPSLSRGSALGSGGTASISGSDTSGTININVGGGAPAGCFASITFATRFDGTPHVLITPVGADGGLITAYVTRSANNFSVCAATAPAAGSSFAFDYWVVE